MAHSIDLENYSPDRLVALNKDTCVWNLSELHKGGCSGKEKVEALKPNLLRLSASFDMDSEAQPIVSRKTDVKFGCFGRTVLW